MRYIISAILLTLTGALDAFASCVCREQGFEFVIFADLSEISQALTPPSAPGWVWAPRWSSEPSSAWAAPSTSAVVRGRALGSS